MLAVGTEVEWARSVITSMYITKEYRKMKCFAVSVGMAALLQTADSSRAATRRFGMTSLVGFAEVDVRRPFSGFTEY